MTTRLLVSVRDADEATIAWGAGADLIDVKEPLRGSLGRADLATVSSIAQRLPAAAPLSVALGELTDLHASDAGISAAHVTGRVSFAKLGLAGCAARPAWRREWREALAALPTGVAPVAVVYADWRSAAAPDPAAIIATAGEVGCRAVLVDTFDKTHGNLLAHWPLAECGRFAARVREAGMLLVLAGSLDRESICRLLPLVPDFVGVRGAVCRGPRHAALDAALVSDLATLVHASSGETRAAVRRARAVQS